MNAAAGEAVAHRSDPQENEDQTVASPPPLSPAGPTHCGIHATVASSGPGRPNNGKIHRMTVNEPPKTESRVPLGRNNGLKEGQRKPLQGSVEEVAVSICTMDVPSHPLLDGDIYSVESSPRESCFDCAAPHRQEPSSKEKAMAEAARARLYGDCRASEASAPKPRPASAPVLPSGPEPAAVEVHYLSRIQVQALSDGQGAVASVREACFFGLESKEWQEVIAALNQLRQLSIHHAADLRQHLPTAVPLLLKHVKSLRSSVCKTALLCLTDLSQDFGDELLPFMDAGGMGSPTSSLLAQLLLKASSKDKRFVIEEAERCLRELCAHMSACVLHPMLLPYVQHRNPKVRGIAGACVASVLPRLDLRALPSGGLAMHLKSAGDLIADKTPQAREAARSILVLVRGAFEGSELQHDEASASRQQLKEEDAEDAAAPQTAWESFCRRELSFAAANAILKAGS